ncbi:hypothetical protein OPU65_03240 [Bacillus paralicheniformis]|nr:hypothetical protein OPU65_03240 [Bacillus paralicheniformis]
MSQQQKHHGSIPKGMHETKPKEFKKDPLEIGPLFKTADLPAGARCLCCNIGDVV